ncbi:MAG: glycosyltransferase family 39 protein, partial [Chloroflexi bacterium]|nr:glycosyltransferase family 39 protein [Chloroflexota bacterium]
MFKRESMSGETKRRSTRWALLIVLMAFCLRIYAIDRQDIWGDEAVSIQLSSGPLPHIIKGGAETVPPLYHVLLHFWLRLGGASALAIRFLSAVFGTLGVAGIYILGHRVFSRPIGVLAALTAAISPALVFYSQEARVYNVLVLFTVASIYWTVRLGEEPVRSRAWTAYLLASLAAGYTHYYGFFVILAGNLVIIIHMLRRRRWRSLNKWLAAQAAIGLAYLPWIYIQGSFLTGKAGGRFEEWTLSVAAGMAEQTLTALAAGLSVSPTTARLIAIPFIVAALSGLFAHPRNGLGKTLLIACMLVPCTLAWLVNPLMPFFFPRYLLLTAPACFILVASGIVAWQRLQRALPAAGVLLVLLGSGYGLHGYYTDDAFVKGRYGQMMAHVQQNARPGDGPVLLNPPPRPPLAQYEPRDPDVLFFPRPE